MCLLFSQEKKSLEIVTYIAYLLFWVFLGWERGKFSIMFFSPQVSSSAYFSTERIICEINWFLQE